MIERKSIITSTLGVQNHGGSGGDVDLSEYRKYVDQDVIDAALTAKVTALENANLSNRVSALKTEVADLRTGADGTVYASAGEAVRQQIKNVSSASSGGGLTADVKQALLNCFANVAWINGNGQTYYAALQNALYPPANLQSISAVYTQSGTVYDTDSLDTLKADLVVTANYSGGTSETVPSSDYTLSGTLTEGTSTITVTYAGLTDTFNVTVTHAGAPEEAWEDGVPYDYELVANEYLSSGMFISYNGWSRTPYLPCKGVSSVTITGESVPAGAYSGWFDADKTFITGSMFTPTPENLAIVPEGACYLVISQADTYLNTITAITPHA